MPWELDVFVLKMIAELCRSFPIFFLLFFFPGTAEEKQSIQTI